MSGIYGSVWSGDDILIQINEILMSGLSGYDIIKSIFVGHRRNNPNSKMVVLSKLLSKF